MCVGSPDAAPLPWPNLLSPVTSTPISSSLGPGPADAVPSPSCWSHLRLPPGSQPGRAETHFLPTGPGLHGS